jgi:hypothetical protein
MHKSVLLTTTSLLATTSFLHGYKLYQNENKALSSRLHDSTYNENVVAQVNIPQQQHTLLYKNNDTTSVLSHLGMFVLSSFGTSCVVLKLGQYDKSLYSWSHHGDKISVLNKMKQVASGCSRKLILGVLTASVLYMSHWNNVNCVSNWLRKDREINKLYISDGSSPFMYVTIGSKWGFERTEAIPLEKQEELRMYLKLTNGYPFFDTGYNVKSTRSKYYMLGKTGYVLNGSGTVTDVSQFTSTLFKFSPGHSLLNVSSDSNGSIRLGSLSFLSQLSKWYIQVNDHTRHLLLKKNQDKWDIEDISDSLTIQRSPILQYSQQTIEPVSGEEALLYGEYNPNKTHSQKHSESTHAVATTYPLWITSSGEIFTKIPTSSSDEQLSNTSTLHSLYLTYSSIYNK